MPAFINLTGQRFGRLLVMERTWLSRERTHWRCKCDCGTITVVRGNSLHGGLTKSCWARFQAPRLSRCPSARISSVRDPISELLW
jgi:hypothetical protein